MSEKSTNISVSSVSFQGLLTIVFITLKLLGVIEWSWWWVFSPIWLSVLAALIVVLVVLLFIVAVNKSWHTRESFRRYLRMKRKQL